MQNAEIQRWMDTQRANSPAPVPLPAALPPSQPQSQASGGPIDAGYQGQGPRPPQQSQDRYPPPPPANNCGQNTAYRNKAARTQRPAYISNLRSQPYQSRRYRNQDTDRHGENSDSDHESSTRQSKTGSSRSGNVMFRHRNKDYSITPTGLTRKTNVEPHPSKEKHKSSSESILESIGRGIMGQRSSTSKGDEKRHHDHKSHRSRHENSDDRSASEEPVLLINV